MKPIILAVALVLSPLMVGCSGCSAIQAVTNGQPVLGGTVVDEKALAFAEEAMQFADDESSAAVHAGLLTAGSPNAVKIADGEKKAHDLLVAARAAQHAGNAADMAGKLSGAQTAIAAIMQLIPRSK